MSKSRDVKSTDQPEEPTVIDQTGAPVVTDTPTTVKRRSQAEINAEIAALEKDSAIRRISGDGDRLPSKREARPDLTVWAQYENISDLSSAGIELFEYSQFASAGFTFTDDKRQLAGRPLVIVHVELGKSDKYASKYALVWCLVGDQTGKIIDKRRFVDFSTGIAAQMAELETSGNLRCPMIVRNGLQESTYTVDHPVTGDEVQATTWYLSEN